MLMIVNIFVEEYMCVCMFVFNIKQPHNSSSDLSSKKILISRSTLTVLYKSWPSSSSITSIYMVSMRWFSQPYSLLRLWDDFPWNIVIFENAFPNPFSSQSNSSANDDVLLIFSFLFRLEILNMFMA